MKLRLLALLMILGALPLFAQDYEIRMHRPRVVGDKAKVSLVATNIEEMSATLEGKVIGPNKKEMIVELDGDLTALAVSPKGKVTKMSCQVERLFKTEAGLKTELLPRGTVIVGTSVDRKGIFEIDGKRTDPEMTKALSLVMSVSKTETTDDELFGTKERKRVGESWDLNGAALAELFGSEGIKMKEIAGKATLTGVHKNKDGPVLLVSMEAKGKCTLGSDTNSPEAVIVMKGTGEFPFDAREPQLKEFVEITFDGRQKRKNANGAEVDITMKAKRSFNGKVQPLKQ